MTTSTHTEDGPPGGDPSDLSGMSSEDQGDTHVTAFSRGLAVIRGLAGSPSPLSIAEVANQTSLNRATARRLLHTLEAESYAGNESGRYSLRPRALELGHAYLASIGINPALQRLLLDLAESVRESASVGVLDEHDVVFVARAETTSPRVMTLALSVGDRAPAYLTAIGRVLLADLPGPELDSYLRTVDFRKRTPKTKAATGSLRRELLKVRRQGYSVVDQEIETGVLAAAVPVRRPGKPTIGISVAAHASHHSAESMEVDFLPVLRRTAVEIQRIATPAEGASGAG